MADFTLDTSGGVFNVPNAGIAGEVWWSDLSPFAQGYVEAMFADLAFAMGKVGVEAKRFSGKGFSDLAPETLQAALHRCEFRLKATNLGVGYAREDGRFFWEEQQRGEHPYFSPATVVLGEDGKVYLRNAAEA